MKGRLTFGQRDETLRKTFQALLFHMQPDYSATLLASSFFQPMSGINSGIVGPVFMFMLNLIEGFGEVPHNCRMLAKRNDEDNWNFSFNAHKETKPCDCKIRIQKKIPLSINQN